MKRRVSSAYHVPVWMASAAILIATLAIQAALAPAADPPSGQERLKAREQARNKSLMEMFEAGRALDAMPRAQLKGKVIGTGGEGVADAKVDAVIWSQAMKGGTSVYHLTAKTAADGSFQF